MRARVLTPELDDPAPAEPQETKPELLFLSPVVPAPLDRGQNVRINAIVLGLTRRYRVTLVVPAGPELELDSPLWSAVEQVVAVPARPGRPSPRELLRFLLRNRTLVRPGVVSWLAPYQEALDRLGGVDRFAVCWVERLGLARLLAGVSGRVVVDMDDVEHRKWARELRLHARTSDARSSLRRLYYAVRFFVLEVLHGRRYGRCVVASAADVEHLRRWGVRNGAHLPNGTTVGELPARAPRTSTGPGRLVFLGNLGYDPNVDALADFEEHVRPALSDAGTTVQLAVVGPGATDELRGRFPGVDFRGFAPDLAAALAAYDVCVVPLRLGGGTKLKVLDAMAAGVPVVTTPVGAEGLDLTDGVHALVADSPRAFAAAVTRLLADPQLAGSLAAAARRLVEDRYSWRSVQDRALALADGVTRVPQGW